MMGRGDGMFWLFVSKPRSVSYRRRCWALGGGGIGYVVVYLAKHFFGCYY